MQCIHKHKKTQAFRSYSLIDIFKYSWKHSNSRHGRSYCVDILLELVYFISFFQLFQAKMQVNEKEK